MSFSVVLGSQMENSWFFVVVFFFPLEKVLDYPGSSACNSVWLVLITDHHYGLCVVQPITVNISLVLTEM